MSTGRTYIFSGGATGGHLFPGIAVAQELRQREPDSRILFVGSEKDLEQSILARHDFERRPLSVESLATLKRHPLRFAMRNLSAWMAARRLIRDERPSVVVGLGGYASAPLVLASASRRVPVVLLEQNVIPGRTNRWLARRASLVCSSFTEAAVHFPRGTNFLQTGNPIRREIADLANRATDAARTATPTLLILGGSQGADSLNEAVVAAIPVIRQKLSGWRIIHQTGPRQVDIVRTAYESQGIAAEVAPFFEQMADLYQSASLAITRAGATTLAELLCCKVPMVLLPYLHAADNHQLANARAVIDGHAGVLVEHRASAAETGRELAERLETLLSDDQRLKAMSAASQALSQPDAAKIVADRIQSLAESSLHAPREES